MDLNLGASLGVAIREFPLGQIYTDYLLFVDRKAVGVIEAKQMGTTLSGVAEQSQSYTTLVFSVAYIFYINFISRGAI
jgi:type I restriction enzyme R subunit